jgi:hypothetical protein
MVSMVLPLPPGLGMVIEGAAAAKLKSGSAVTVMAEEVGDAM